MTDLPDCPMCGRPACYKSEKTGLTLWKCDSRQWPGGEFIQSQACLIAALRLAIADRDRALEWVSIAPDRRPICCGNEWSVWDANGKVHTGPTPLAAIQAAMRAEQQSTTKGE